MLFQSQDAHTEKFNKKFEPIKWLDLLSQTDLPEVFRSSWLAILV